MALRLLQYLGWHEASYGNERAVTVNGVKDQLFGLGLGHGRGAFHADAGSKSRIDERNGKITSPIFESRGTPRGGETASTGTSAREVACRGLTPPRKNG